MSEKVITELRAYDVSILNNNRAFLEREQVTEDDFFLSKEVGLFNDNGNLESLLAEMQDEIMYEIMKNLDPELYQICDLRVQGYSIKEISDKLGIKIEAVYKKIQRFRTKIKKVVQK